MSLRYLSVFRVNTSTGERDRECKIPYVSMLEKECDGCPALWMPQFCEFHENVVLLDNLIPVEGN